MFIEPTKTYYDHGEPYTPRARFLILARSKNEGSYSKNTIRCFVRKVALRQLGHFMIGVARVHNTFVIVSGPYGNNGLTVDLPQKIWEKGVPLPDYLFEAWKVGGGWNGAGREAGAMREWANKNLKILSPKGSI